MENMKKYVAEFIGTLVLVLFACGSGGTSSGGSSGSKLPQTGRNRLAPLLMLGAGGILAAAGGITLAGKRKKRGRHAK